MSSKKYNNAPHFEFVMERFVTRRRFIAGALATSALPLSSCGSPKSSERRLRDSGLNYEELAHELDDTLKVADGYDAQVLLRWGDPLFPDSPSFDPHKQSKASQLKQFGYNNDFVGFIPLLDADKNPSSDRGLLVVNHEYTVSSLMFPDAVSGMPLSKDQVDVEIAAHGLSVVEVVHKNSVWSVDVTSKYNRRITPDTEAELFGPAAGSQRLTSTKSLDGVKTFGTYSNCAGGVTPWGTILTGEENVDKYFMGNPDETAEAENYRRFGVGEPGVSWGSYYDRWDLNKSPSELLHMGWVVEIDPFDPKSKPKKLTALGRLKHEGCNLHVNSDGKVIAYTGDDQKFEYIYKFVSRDAFDEGNRTKNVSLLHFGTLFVAKFLDSGELKWLPLVFGQGPLTSKNGFHSQGDISLDTRKAADLMGATPMDRPEDVEVNPENGHVYAMLTNNSKRKQKDTDLANPRPYNSHGQVVEFWPENGDHTSETFRWDLFLLAGNPKKTVTQYHPATSENGWLSCPDNCAFDSLGNLWISSDGAQKAGIADGIWSTQVSGDKKALTKRFLSAPKGAEVCGPFFTPNDETLFCSIQHPAEGSSYSRPSTRWPDFSDTLPPRPSVVAITKIGGGRVGS